MSLSLTSYPFPDSLPSGKIFTFNMVMTPYPDKRTRTIRVWLPEDYDGVRCFPVIYMHAGQNVFAGEGEPKNKLYEKENAQIINPASFLSVLRLQNRPLTEELDA